MGKRVVSTYQHLLGRTFNFLKLLEIHPDGKPVRLGFFRCVAPGCGKEKWISIPKVMNGLTKSCGCQRAAAIAKARTTHGGRRTPEYSIWRDMMGRCYNKNRKVWGRYGGRGIKVSQRWHDFTAFLADMGHRPSHKHTIERRNNDGDYSVTNCYWATRVQQAANRSTRRTLTYNGETMSVTEWARRLGVSDKRLFTRVYRGWKDADIITLPFGAEPSDNPTLRRSRELRRSQRRLRLHESRAGSRRQR